MDQVIFDNIDKLFGRFINNVGQWFSDHGFEVLTILFVAWIIRRYGAQFLAKVLESTARPDLYPTKGDRIKRINTLEGLANGILKIGTYIIAGIMIINELGVDTTPLLASAGALGLVVGIGAQSLVRDIATGIFIILGNQYRVGDNVELRVTASMASIEGYVEEIGVRSTTLRSLSGDLHHVPNGSIMTASNKTIGFSRINIDILFPKDIDIEKLRLVINRVGIDLAADPDFEKKIKEPPQFLQVAGIEQEGLRVKILGKTSSNDSQEVSGEFNNRLLKALKKAKLATL